MIPTTCMSCQELQKRLDNQAKTIQLLQADLEELTLYKLLSTPEFSELIRSVMEKSK